MSSRMNYDKLNYWNYSNRHHMTTDPKYDDPYTYEKRMARFEKMVYEENKAEEKEAIKNKQKKQKAKKKVKTSKNSKTAKISKNSKTAKTSKNSKTAKTSKNSKQAKADNLQSFKNGYKITYILEISYLDKKEKNALLMGDCKIDIEVSTLIKGQCNVYSPTFILCDGRKKYMAFSNSVVFHDKRNYTYTIGSLTRCNFAIEKYNLIFKGTIKNEIPFAIAISKRLY